MIVPQGTHGLNPFRARLGKEAAKPNVAMGNTPGDYNAFDARGMAIRLPVMVAGWGYDIFGRPVPSKAVDLVTLNAQVDMGYYGFANDNASDTRGSPAPYGAETPLKDYVGGGLDLRYNQRHGVWQTDHSFYARITAVTATDSTSNKFYWIYNWEEVEVRYNPIKNQNSGDPFNRALSNPAKGKAINVAEVVRDAGDRNYGYLRAGTIIELKSHLVAKSGDGDYTLEPVYLFNHTEEQPVFLRIDWNSTAGYPAPLTNEDASYGASSYNGCNRFLYRAEIAYFNESNTTGGKFGAPFGAFTGTNIFVQCINVNEWGNPVNTRGVVAPGIIMATGSIVHSAGTNLSWTGSTSTLASGAYPPGFMIKPIWHNTIVEAKRMKNQSVGSLSSNGPLYYFSMVNGHDGACATGAWPALNTTQETGRGENTTVRRQ